MIEANFILKTQENMRMPKDEKANTVKKGVLIIIAILFAGSIVLGSNPTKYNYTDYLSEEHYAVRETLYVNK